MAPEQEDQVTAQQLPQTESAPQEAREIPITAQKEEHRELESDNVLPSLGIPSEPTLAVKTTTASAESLEAGDAALKDSEVNTHSFVGVNGAAHVGNTVNEEVKPNMEGTGSPSEVVQAEEKLQDLSISTATLRPQRQASPLRESLRTPPPVSSMGSENPYLDPTPRTPETASRAPSRSSSQEDYNEKGKAIESGATSEAELDTRQAGEIGRQAEKGSQSEIQSIMEQFTDQAEAPRQEEIMSPRMELAGPFLSVGQFPPRRSSLENLRHQDDAALGDRDTAEPPPVPPKSPPNNKAPSLKSPMIPTSPSSLHQPPPPEPDPDLPFDFHRFLEQLRHKSADPVAKFLRSFLTEFGKKQWMVHEQVKIISDFLTFITNKMAQCDVWRDVSDAEFDNAKEGMEKLVMNRLYTQTFSPALPPPAPVPRRRSKRKEQEKSAGPGRRGQHQEDVERDEILAQKIRIYSWVREKHLDIPEVGAQGKRFLTLAQQELLKIKGYRAPRDKVICILNCCKVIFGLLKNAKSKDTSADSFVPLLIYVVLQANPEHMVSNVQYILRFRNQDKLGGESGYYLSSLSGAIQFIETLDRTNLTISDEEFEKNVEVAVQAIAEKNREAEADAVSPTQPQFSEKSTSENSPRTSTDIVRGSGSPSRRAKGHQPTLSNDSMDDNPAVGLLRTFQRPLSTLGRIFSDEGNSAGPSQAAPAPRPLSPAVFQPPPEGHSEKRDHSRPRSSGMPKRYAAEEAAARQASAEAAEAHKIQQKEHRNVVE